MANRGIHILIGSNTQYHTYITKERGNNHTLDDNQFEDAPRLGTNGLADAKLVRTLLNGNQHDIAHAYDTTEQGKQTYDPERRVNDGNTLLHLHARCIAVPYPESALIFRMHLMVGIQAATKVFLEVLALVLGIEAMKGQLDVTRLVGIGTIDALDCRISGIDIAFTIATILVDTHYLKREIAYLNILTQQTLKILWNEFLGMLIAHYKHLTTFEHVVLVDKASTNQTMLVNLRMHRIDTCYRTCNILFAIADSSTNIIKRTYLVDMILKIILSHSDISRLESDTATFLQTIIRLRSATSVNLHRVRQPVFVLLHVGINQTIACTQQYDDHEDAPRYSKTRKRRAELVPPGCRPYFN